MLTAMIVARRTPWYRAYAWLAIATGIGFFLRIITSLAIMHGRYQSGTLYDLAWIAPFLVLCGSGARRARFPEGAGPGRDPLAQPATRALAALPVFLIPLVGYGALFIQPLGGAGDSFRALLTGLMTVAGPRPADAAARRAGRRAAARRMRACGCLPPPPSRRAI